MSASDDVLFAQAQAREQTTASHGVTSDVHSVKSALLDPELSPTIKSGITRADDTDQHGHTRADRERIFAERDAYEASPEGQREAAARDERQVAQDEDRVELENMRRAVAIQEIYEAPDDEQVAWLIAHLDGPGREQLVELGGYTSEEIAAYVAMGQRDIAEAQAADKASAQIQQVIDNMMARDLAFADLVSERGMDADSPQAQAWRAQMERVADDAGVNVSALSGTEYADAIRGAEYTLRDVMQASEDARFKRSVYFADDTSVASGLRVLGNNGFQPVVEHPTFAPRPVDPVKLDRAMSGAVVETADEVRASITDDSRMSREYREVKAQGHRDFAAAQAKAKAIFGTGI